MLVCRYGETTRRTPRPERFLPGAFTRSVERRRSRIAFTDCHTEGTGDLRGKAIAHPVFWDTSDPGELRATIKFHDDEKGWDMFHRAQDGEIDAGSVGFLPLEERAGPDGIREIAEAQLHHVALLSRSDGHVPAYESTRLLEVREDYSARLAAVRAVSWAHVDPDACVTAADMAKLVHGG